MQKLLSPSIPIAFLTNILCIISATAISQNLLDTSSWTLGSGSVSGFSINGSVNENWRIDGEDHVGEPLIIWEARNDAANGPDGGWNTSYKAINNTKTYRFAVWIKKTNSNDGRTYFGTQRWQADNTLHNYTIYNLSGSVNRNPYFWDGDLPLLDRWYLLVGFVHNKNYSGTTNFGKIYDGVTGEEVVTIRDFKFTNNTTILRHRAYLYYDTNIDDLQYFMKPRLEEVNGQEPSITELLQINENSRLLFEYDLGGHQKNRFYCDQGFCFRNNQEKQNIENSESRNQKDTILEDADMHSSIDLILVNIHPNPTNGIFNISLDESLEPNNYEVSIYDINGKLINSYSNNSSRNIVLDITNSPSGSYIVHIHLSDTNFITKMLIKK